MTFTSRLPQTDILHPDSFIHLCYLLGPYGPFSHFTLDKI